MKRFELDVKFTEKVSEYIAKGYVINTKTMCGHQGEEGKVDLIKGDELIRVWLMRESSATWLDRDGFHGRTVTLYVGRWNKSVSKHGWDTVWFKDIEVLESIVYYEIESDWLVDNLEDAMEYQTKHYDRCKYHRESGQVELDSRYYEFATRLLKRKYDYKRVSYDKLRVFRSGINYYFTYNGRKYWFN